MILASVTLKDISTGKRVGMVYMVSESIDEGVKEVVKKFSQANKLNEKNIRMVSVSILASEIEGDRQLIISK